MPGSPVQDMASGQSSSPAPARVASRVNFWKPCAILLDGRDGPILGGKGLGVQSVVNSHLFMFNSTHVESSIGISLEFPYGQANEEEGFGICHMVDYSRNIIATSDMYKVEVRFPREGFSRTVEPVDDGLQGRFASVKFLSLVEVNLRDSTLTKVHGFGMPFKSGCPFAGLLNQTLLDLARQEKFQIVVAAPSNLLESKWDVSRLPPSFAHPYGNIHSWNVERYTEILNKTKDHPLAPPAWSYHDDNAHLAAMTQSQVQDFMSFDRAAKEIASKSSAYFVESAQGNTLRYYVVMALSKTLKKNSKHALGHLAKGAFKLDLYDNCEDEAASGEWDARAVNHPQDIDVLKAHPIAEHEMVLDVRRPMEAARGSNFEVITFSDGQAARFALNEGADQWNCAALHFDAHADYERKVNAVCLFQPGEQPTNFSDMSRDEVDFKMSLHRDLVRGTGFYDTLLGEFPSIDAMEVDLEGPSLEPLSNSARSLPVVNLLGTDEDYIKALMQEALPGDRGRFQTYLSERPLGLGVITGLGKTTALAVGTIGMTCSLGKIYATGPTDLAVDNFAARLDHVDTSVTDRMNESKNAETRVRYKHVVRGYKIDDEVSAFFHLLRSPDDGDKAAPNSFLSGQSEWKMHLSAAYWLLILLRFPKVRPLRLDDSVALHELRSRIESDSDNQLHRLRALAAQGMDWVEYERGAMVSKGRLDSLLEDVIRIADIVCTTPSLSAKEPYSAWKHFAQGVAVDDAARMIRPDLYCVWGNTLLPCLMAGDDKQMPPPALYSHNRFGQHARISPLLWFKAMGWPIYRLGLPG